MQTCLEHRNGATASDHDVALYQRRLDPAVELVESQLHPRLVDGDLGAVVTTAGDHLPHVGTPQPAPLPAMATDAA